MNKEKKPEYNRDRRRWKGQIKEGIYYIASLGKFPFSINPFKPEFTIVIFIHYKPQIAVAILDL